MNKPVTRGSKRKKKANATPPLGESSASSLQLELDEELLLPSSAQEEVTSPQEERLSPDIKRSRIDDETLEETVAGNTVDSEPAAIETHTTESRTENEPITRESPAISRSQEDVMIVGDVQVARPEVIDLEKLPTIRQGGSVVVDLTNDSGFHDSNVVDLTSESPADSSIDSSPVIVCVNRIYRGDPISQLPSCRFAQPSMLNRQLFNADDEIQEVVDSNTTSEQNTGLVVASTSSSDDPAAKTTERKMISCPICWDDENTIKRRKRKLMSTTCGHVFCDQCIRSAVQRQNKCPTCRKKLTLRQLHPIFL